MAASFIDSSEASASITPTTDTFDSLPATEAVNRNSIDVIAEEVSIRRLRIGLRAVGSVLTKMLWMVSGFSLLFIGGFLFLGLTLLWFIAIIVSQPLIQFIISSLASMALNGAISLLIGNAILRGAFHAHYTTNTVAAAIGAVGGIVSTFIFGIVSPWLPKDEHGGMWWPFNLVGSVAVATLSGTIGFAILQRYNIDCRGIDILHASGAGALGGVVMPLILPLLFSPLLIAVKLGFRWVYIRSNESWSETGAHRSWYFYSYGTGGHDADIREEIARIERPRQVPQQYRAQVEPPYRAYGSSSRLL